jgi:8-oxo-dGTP pyrophosphatase MutT (NUDIX family)
MSYGSIVHKGLDWTRCKNLENAIPRLKKLLSEKANVHNSFPLFSPKVNKAVWQTVPIKNKRKAAVLVPLVSYQGEPSLLFTTRSKNVSHSSDVSFPGGHFEESVDASLEATAIRETQEELLGNYPWDEIEIIGKTTPLPSKIGTSVTPVIGILPYEIGPHSFPGCEHEVQDVFSVSLQELINTEGEEHLDRFNSKIPVFTTREGKRIWGLTAVITKPILHKLLKPVFFEKEFK